VEGRRHQGAARAVARRHRTLLAANLVAAVMAFKPFGGSADDLRREQQALRVQLARLQTRAATASGWWKRWRPRGGMATSSWPST